MNVKHTAIAIIARVLAALIQPPASITPSQWAAKNLKVPDGPHSGDLWSAELTPYIVEPLDNMGPDSPVNKQSIKKSAQTGFSMMAICGVGHSIDCDPHGGILLVQPTQDALDKFIRDKLNPAIEASPPLKDKIAPQVSRNGDGSTTYNRRYPGGSLAMTIANSTAGLRSLTKKRRIKDEASEYPDDLDGQGSPHLMIEARGESFLVAGDWKETNISTPTVLGACYIDAEYKAGDQRRWHVRCQHCGDQSPTVAGEAKRGNEFVFEFGQFFRFNESFPYQAHYVAPCCGSIIEAHEKFELVRNGRWIATAPAPGKHPSYHFDTLSSPFVPWDKIAERWLAAKGDPSKLKAFYNLTLGLAFEIKGDAPDWERLRDRREDYRRATIAPHGLMVTTFADVQLRGIYHETVAWAPNGESWVIDADVIQGDTTSANGGAFAELDKIYRREYADAFGGKRMADAFGVDSGFRTHVVYTWCAARHRAYACKGVDGWSRPALGGGTLQDIDNDGHKVAQGVKLWQVGTWVLKGIWYDNLRIAMPSSGSEKFAPCFVHFGKFLDDNYFKQITAEYLADVRHGGQNTKRWEIRGKQDNHFLDCRVGNMALADHLGLSRMTDDEWKILARERAAALLAQGDLFAPRPLAVQSAALAAQVQSGVTPAATAIEGSASSPAESSLPADGSAPCTTPPAVDHGPVPETPAPADASPSADTAPAAADWLGRDVKGWLDR